MAGHSKWAKVKHYKAITDAKKGKIFSKLAKEITVATKTGGGDPGYNPRLRTILLKARTENMPADNIERAIKKGTGELPGVSYEEMTYEGYGPGGIALLVEVLTDNKNRTAPEIRSLFAKHGGNMAGSNAVKHLFHRKGHLIVPREQIGEDELLGLVLDAGAEDVVTHETTYEITTDLQRFEAVHKAIEGRGLKPAAAEVTYLPLTSIRIEDDKTAQSILKFVDALEENDDVQNVHSNFDIPEALLEKAAAAAA